MGKYNEKNINLDEVVRSSQQSIAEGESESSDDESEAEMKFIKKTVKSRGLYIRITLNILCFLIIIYI